MHINEGCVLQYESKYEKITIQYKRANRAKEDWQELSKSAIQTNISPDTTEVEVNDLTIDKVYNFRGLFEDKTTGEFVHIKSMNGITIKSNFLLSYTFIF